MARLNNFVAYFCAQLSCPILCPIYLRHKHFFRFLPWAWQLYGSRGGGRG